MMDVFVLEGRMDPIRREEGGEGGCSGSDNIKMDVLFLEKYTRLKWPRSWKDELIFLLLSCLNVTPNGEKSMNQMKIKSMYASILL